MQSNLSGFKNPTKMHKRREGERKGSMLVQWELERIKHTAHEAINCCYLN